MQLVQVAIAALRRDVDKGSADMMVRWTRAAVALTDSLGAPGFNCFILPVGG